MEYIGEIRCAGSFRSRRPSDGAQARGKGLFSAGEEHASANRSGRVPALYPVFPRASVNSTAYSAAVWSKARSCCFRASRASANRRCCCKSASLSTRTAGFCMSPAKNRPRRSSCAPDVSASITAACPFWRRPNINKIIPEIDLNGAEVVIIDSIQTVYDDEVASSPGTVTQVKQTAMQLIHKAKNEGVTVIISWACQ